MLLFGAGYVIVICCPVWEGEEFNGSSGVSCPFSAVDESEKCIGRMGAEERSLFPKLASLSWIISC